MRQVFISHAEMEQIRRSRKPLRTIRYQAACREDGRVVACPLEIGHVYVLKSAKDAHGIKITVIRATLTGGEDSWAVDFVLGDERAFLEQDSPIYLHRNPGGGKSDYTDRQGMAAAGEPEVMLPLKADMEKARQQAKRQRLTPQREASQDLRKRTETLRESLATMKAEQADRQLKRIERNLDALDRVLADEPDILDGASVSPPGTAPEKQSDAPYAEPQASPEAA